MLQEESSEQRAPVLSRPFLHTLLQAGKRQYLGRAIIASAEMVMTFMAIRIAPNPISKMMTRTEFQVPLYASEGISDN